jgi:hypothetical protein
MAARLINLDRQMPMFLPCDLRERVPQDKDHIVHFILDAVEQIPTTQFCRSTTVAPEALKVRFIWRA